ncbi:MAG TPA: hypothetical protein VFB80_13735 [Pirellulaceae bacterium]|nr:hypothetical protein [Pirellulaceae bacterium]
MSYNSHKCLFGLAAAILLAGCSESVQTPTSYKKWNAKDGLFAVEYPEGWKADGGGKQGIQWAEFKKGSCIITIDTNTSGSVVTDIAASGLGGGDDGVPIDPKVAEKLAPAAAAHNWIAKDPQRFEKFKNYKEEEPTKITPPIGEGRKSLFTASAGMGQKVKGYRVTIPTNTKAIIVFAYGAEKDWSKVQGAYDKIFDGMEMGTPEM